MVYLKRKYIQLTLKALELYCSQKELTKNIEI